VQLSETVPAVPWLAAVVADMALMASECPCLSDCGAVVFRMVKWCIFNDMTVMNGTDHVSTAPCRLLMPHCFYNTLHIHTRWHVYTHTRNQLKLGGIGIIVQIPYFDLFIWLNLTSVILNIVLLSRIWNLQRRTKTCKFLLCFLNNTELWNSFTSG